MSGVSASDWIKGIALSVLASIIGGASKLAIRKSWLMVENLTQRSQQEDDDTNRNQLQSHGATRNSDASAGAGGSPIPPPPYAFQDTPSALDSSGRGAQNGGSKDNGPRSPSGIELLERSTKEVADGKIEELAVTLASTQGSLDATDVCSAASIACSAASIGCADEDDDQTRHQSGYASSHAENERHAKTTQRRAICLRLSGMLGMTVLNPLCCVLAMNYASPSILAPFSGLTLVWIIVFSEALIDERPKTVQILAAGLIICGETIVAIFGDHTNDGAKSIDDVRAAYADPTFLMYLFLMVLWMGMLGYVILRKNSQFSTKTLRRFAWGVAGGSITGLQNFLKDSLTVSACVYVCLIPN